MRLALRFAILIAALVAIPLMGFGTTGADSGEDAAASPGAPPAESATSYPPGSTPAGTFSSVRIRTRFDPEGGVFFEGAVTFFTIRRIRSGRIALRGSPPAHGTLARGRFRIRAFDRTCSGNCGFLDRPQNRCSRAFRLPGGTSQRIVIITRAARPCELRIPSKQ